MNSTHRTNWNHVDINLSRFGYLFTDRTRKLHPVFYLIIKNDILKQCQAQVNVAIISLMPFSNIWLYNFYRS
jgi:hypothetical protein